MARPKLPSRRPTMGKLGNRVIFLNRTSDDETLTGHCMKGESLDKTRFPAGFSRAHRREEGTDSAELSWHRDNDCNISPSRGKGALPALVGSPLRRECPAPAILLEATATIAPRPFFVFCPPATRSPRRQVRANYSTEMESPRRYASVLAPRRHEAFDRSRDP